MENPQQEPKRKEVTKFYTVNVEISGYLDKSPFLIPISDEEIADFKFDYDECFEEGDSYYCQELDELAIDYLRWRSNVSLFAPNDDNSDFFYDLGSILDNLDRMDFKASIDSFEPAVIK